MVYELACWPLLALAGLSCSPQLTQHMLDLTKSMHAPRGLRHTEAQSDLVLRLMCLQTNFNRSENYPDPSLYTGDVSYNLTCNCLLWTDNPCQGEVAYVSPLLCGQTCMRSIQQAYLS